MEDRDPTGVIFARVHLRSVSAAGEPRFVMRFRGEDRWFDSLEECRAWVLASVIASKLERS